MKNSKARKGKRSAPAVAVAEPRRNPWTWIYALAGLVALLAAFEVYWPAIRGPFLLDDMSLYYMRPNAAELHLFAWVHQVRPLLMFTFWANFQQSGAESTFGYHLVNVFLHFFNSIFIFLIVRRVLGWAAVEDVRARILAFFAAGLFLLHPLQTESVSYIASRSETLSVFFVLAALAVFITRSGPAASVPRIAALLALFAAAGLSKEHTAVLPAALLLTDYYWNFEFSSSTIRRNWKLYVPIAAGAALFAALVLRLLRANPTAGFQIQGLAWYQYFFTQCRVIWDYVRLYVFPLGQNLDPDVDISRNILAHGAILGLAALVAVTVLAWIYRRRFPVGSYGWFLFLILIAPTSSFVPIFDPMAERRLYLPFIGLLLITVEFARRWKPSRNAFVAALALVLIAEGALTYQRNVLWGSEVAIWKDTVDKSPRKVRPRFQLALADFHAGDCAESVNEYQRTAALETPGYDLLLDWALAYDCAGNTQQAIVKLQQAVALHPNAHTYSQLGREYGKSGHYAAALQALAMAQQINPRFAMTYYTLGNVHQAQGDLAQAREDYQKVLTIDPNNEPARAALARLAIR